MAVYYIDYTSVPSHKRAAAGHQQMITLRSKLRDPTLTQEQKDAIQVEVDKINAWMNGTATPAVPSVPHHSTVG